MGKYFLSYFLLLASYAVSAQSASQLWEKANQAYQKGEYSYAIELYEKILNHDIVSPQVFYNLGNAYFKNNNIGKAIINYERALRLSPGNDNIRHNLAVANNRTIDNVIVPPPLFYERWLKNLYMMQSADGWAIWAIASLFLSLTLCGVYLFSRTAFIKRVTFYFTLILITVAVSSAIFAQINYTRQNNHNEAIIIQPRVTVKSSPSAQSPDLFLVHEGTKVFIRGSHNDWYEINLADGNVGWINSRSFEII